MSYVNRLFGWALAVVLGIAAVLLMIGSREPVVLRLALVPESLELPLFVAVLGAWVIGFICGGIVMWFSEARWRRLARDEMVDLEELRRENDSLRADLAEARAAADRADAAPGTALTAPGNDNGQAPRLPGRAG